jgi:NADH-quinone oxidoreductase subunit M
VLYTVAGSALMMVAIIALYFGSGAHTFDIMELQKATIPAAFQIAVFPFLFLGFAIKLPMFPFHTWLPDAHVEAPTAVSVLLAGVLLKMGGYGMFRLCLGILPEGLHYYAGLLVALAVISVLYGAVISLVQQDLKKLVAYSSVSHMGYVLLGLVALTPISLNGAALQMFTHGTITGLLFLAVGLVYEKTHTRQIAELGGLAQRMPWVAVVFVMAGMASLGLPGMSGFVAEFLVFTGSFPVYVIPTVLSVIAICITAGYLLWMLQRAFFGELNPRWSHLGDGRIVEMIPLYTLLAVIILVGIYPSILTNLVNSGVAPLVERVAQMASVVH